MKKALAVFVASLVLVMAGVGVGLLIQPDSDVEPSAGSPPRAAQPDRASEPQNDGASEAGPASANATAPEPVKLADLLERTISDTVEFSVDEGRLGGSLAPEAVIASLSSFDASSGWEAELPVDAGLTTFSGQLGLSSDDPARTEIRFVVRKDTAQGNVLYRGGFTPATDATTAVFDVRGATKLILQWPAPDAELPGDGAHFVFVDAQLAADE